MTQPLCFKPRPRVSLRKEQETPAAHECEKRIELDTLCFSRSPDKRLPVRGATALSFSSGRRRGITCNLEIHA